MSELLYRFLNIGYSCSHHFSIGPGSSLVRCSILRGIRVAGILGLKLCLLDTRRGRSRRWRVISWCRGRRHTSSRSSTRWSGLGVALWEKADLPREVAALALAGME